MLRIIRRFAREGRGASAALFGLTLPLLAVAIAAALDYSNATLQHTRLNAIADSAVLAGLTPAMLQEPFPVGQAAARQAFISQASTVSTIIPGKLQVTVTPNNPGNNAYTRQLTISYVAQVQNFITGIFAPQTTYISGSSTATAGMPPNIDFYLLLDNSPSMSLPADQNGIDVMIDLTSAQGGCAFACHQASTGNSDTAGNPYYNPNNPQQACPGAQQANGANPGCVQMDNYALARANSITLRLDELTTAIGDLMQTATDARTGSVPPTYRFAVNAMDSQYTIGLTGIMALTSDFTSAWARDSSNFSVMEMFSNDKGCVPVTVNNVTTCTQGTTPDVSTNYDNALGNLSAALPVAGQGTNQAGDTPQEILFFVTDGVEDKSNGSRLIQAINANGAHNYCNDIKAKGAQIAILYTDYLPISNNSYYVQHVQPIQADIAPALQACASPGLFFNAGLSGNFSSALLTLFRLALARTSHLTN